LKKKAEWNSNWRHCIGVGGGACKVVGLCVCATRGAEWFGPKLLELSCCGPVLGCKKVERCRLQPPFLCKNRERRWGVSGMVSGGGFAYLLVWCLGPSCFSLSSLAAHWQAVSPSSVVGCMACRQARHLVVFGGVWNSDHFQSQFRFSLYNILQVS